MIVLDSSYTLALVMPDEAQPASTHAVTTGRLMAPFVWPLEIANALRSNQRRGRLLAAGADVLLDRIGALGVDVASPPHAVPRRHLEAALAHDLTPYDACYITLAQQLSAPLATLDAGLAAAAARVGVPTFA